MQALALLYLRILIYPDIILLYKLNLKMTRRFINEFHKFKKREYCSMLFLHNFSSPSDINIKLGFLKSNYQTKLHIGNVLDRNTFLFCWLMNIFSEDIKFSFWILLQICSIGRGGVVNIAPLRMLFSFIYRPRGFMWPFQFCSKNSASFS